MTHNIEHSKYVNPTYLMHESLASVARCTQHLRGKDICTPGLIILKKLFILLSLPSNPAFHFFLAVFSSSLSLNSPPSRVLLLLPHLSCHQRSPFLQPWSSLGATYLFRIFVFFIGVSLCDRAVVGVDHPSQVDGGVAASARRHCRGKHRYAEFAGVVCNSGSYGSR